ncbi:hypothetical protein MMIC_P1280 [Mariprofundus micogutta]|uniref:Outer membrane cytochrome MtrC/MtrF-like domain-containing protein n=1 Tax=Mariprofundus micogutta TaxID=1921010 RepID=A0A1L8CN22_9PROT|nr:multiheme c-type cytochrome [Mariprofundus micogutta]GAV20315.1 hypothetical protein MMIC_P1280 [Mariprofundus micogutta]
MKRQIWMAVGVIVTGMMLAGASVDPGLPVGYWDNPQAKEVIMPHDWSELETDLRPESCAQCHSEQFDSWKKSLHAKAYSPGLVGQFPGMGHEEANSCLQCHAPLKEQLYTSPEAMQRSVSLRLKHEEGFSKDADMDAPALPLTHSGVSCAVCHVRGMQRFGPPPKNSGAIGKVKGPVHGGFTATKAFESSQFCASCHQFPQSMAINGKPLENTVTEWKKSSFEKKGVTCQQCHMPDRKHEFRGIHDPEMVAKGLRFKLVQDKKSAALTMTSIWIGHAFPTYVTPKVIVLADALDGRGISLRQWQWEIIREIEYDNGWQEKRDTRLMPGESREFMVSKIPSRTTSIRYRVLVEPDHFYKGTYSDLLSREMTPEARAHIQKAGKLAAANDYVLFEQSLSRSSSMFQ